MAAAAVAVGFFVLFFCIIRFLVYRKLRSHPKCKSVESSSSLTPSPPSQVWTHQVFPSFRGEDVRKGFLSHIQKEFKIKGIVPFIDNEIKRGESIGPELFRAIRESKIAIVLLSKNYSSSSWCLNELVEIMKCREEIGQTVMTVFYRVDPSDVRKQTGDFGKAFEKTCLGKTEEVKQRWKQALMDVANILGEDSRNWDREADMVVKIAKDVSDVLNYTPSRDFDDYVGIQPHITKISSLLSLESGDVRMIGILGPPGIGKTTIARVLYEQVSEDFQFSAFVENIRLSYLRCCHDEGCLEIMNGERQRKINLQRRLLSEIFNQKDVEIHHLGAVQERLKDHKVLVILDGVDQLEQLIAMAKETRWFGYGSRIIITTQDQRLLRAHGINHIYKMELPSTDEALQIFCLYAFGQKFPFDGFKKLARDFTELAGELPLALRVMGSYLRGMSLDEWKNALPRLKSSLDGGISEIERTLRFSYDVLSDKDKALFLHIACLFHGFRVIHVKQWLANSGLDVNHGFEVLTHKSLISTNKGIVGMHSLLQQLGIDIVRKQSIGEPGKRQFLVDVNEISDVITDNTGTGSILGIMLNVSQIEDEIVIEEMVFDGMTNLQFLIFDHCLRDKLNFPLGVYCLPRKLRLLHWDYCPLRFWPSKFSAKFLVEIIMRGSKFEKLWEGIQPLKNLKRMDLSDARSLKEIPDLSNATNLESLLLMFCTSLLEIPPSIGGTTSLKKLDLGGCTSLMKLPSSICNVISLEKLNLSACTGLKTFPEISTNIQKLNLSGSAIEEMPSSIRLLPRLYKLVMLRCRSLKVFPPVPDGIEFLDLSDTEIEEVPLWIENLSRLRHLAMFRCKKLDNISLSRISKMAGVSCVQITRGDEDASSYLEVNIRWFSDFLCEWTLQPDMLEICLPETVYTSPVSLFFIRNAFKTIPDCIKQLPRLRQLSLYECRSLVSLPQLPDSLLSLDAENCVSLETIDGSFHNPEIRLNFLNCISLNQEAREVIQTSVCKHALLPAGEVPPYFIHRATGGSLTIHLKERHLPKFLRFKACLLLFDDDVDADDYDDVDNYDEVVTVYCDYNTYPYSVHYTEKDTMRLSCRVEGKQNGLTNQYGSSLHLLPTPHVSTEHIYIFEASLSLDDCNYPEAESELVFDFKVNAYFWGIKECGLQLLELPHVHQDEEEHEISTFI